MSRFFVSSQCWGLYGNANHWLGPSIDGTRHWLTMDDAEAFDTKEAAIDAATIENAEWPGVKATVVEVKS